MSLIVLDSDDAVSEELAAEERATEESEIVLSLALWSDRLDKRHANLNSAVAAGVARARTASLDADGKSLEALAFRLHARRHDMRAEILGHTSKYLADLPAEKASAA